MTDEVALAIKVTADAKEAADGLGDVTSQFEDLSDSAKSTGATAGQTARALGGLSKGFALVGADGIAEDLQQAGQALQFVKGASASVTLALKSQTLVTEGSKAATIAKSIAEKAAAIGTGAMTAAQWALNAALSANPIGVVIVLVLAAVAAVVLLYKRSERAREIIDAVFGAIQKIVGVAVDFIRDHWKLLVAIITGPIGIAVALVAKHWDTIKAGAAAVVDWVKEKWPALKEMIVGPIETARDVLDKVWDKITGAFTTAKETLTTTAGNVQDAVAGAFGAVKQAVQDVIDAVDLVIGKVQDFIDKLKSVPHPDLNPFNGRTATGGGITGSYSSEVRNGGRAQGAPVTVNVHLNGYTFVGDEAKVSREIKRILGDELRRLGPVT